MRWNLLKTFDKIYIIDLHGNAKKKETAPDGSVDQNVFDIMQGVSINIFIKTGEKKYNKLGEVFHYDLFGERDLKYNFLSNNSLKDIVFKKINYNAPFYFFVPKDEYGRKQYEKGFKVNHLFPNNTSGIVSMGDSFIFDKNPKKLLDRIKDFLDNDYSEEQLRDKYKFGKNYAKWILENKKEISQINLNPIKISYRPFDDYYTIFDNKLLWRWRYETMQHFLNGENIGLVIARQCASDWRYIFITKLVGEFNLTGVAGRYGSGYFFPLYLYPDQTTDGMFADEGLTHKGRKPNLNMEIVEQIAKKLSLKFVPEKDATTPSTNKQIEINHYSSKNSPPNLGGVPERRGGKLNNLPKLKTFRKQLRNNLTPAEATLWNMLKNKQLKGRKFRRQHSVGNYILDFYCPSERLAIELDGEGHFSATQEDYDYERNLFLEAFGIKVLRFENKEVFENPENVLLAIEKEFGWTTTTPSAETNTSTKKASETEEDFFAPIDILDYIYAVLHSPTYREKYKEFLKIDFPRVPYPKDKNTFWQLVKLGSELRQLHLLESPKVEHFITSYPIDGDNKITTRITKKDWEITDRDKQLGRIWINDKQYFDNIPLVAWEFYIGGYQPAQKWLKDRRGRTLSFEDIMHYQKIIVALTETDRIMKEIDKIDFE